MSKYVYSYDGGKLWSPYNYCGFYEEGERELLVKDENGVISAPFKADTNNAHYRDLGIVLPKEIKTNNKNYDGINWTNGDIEVIFNDSKIIGKKNNFNIESIPEQSEMVNMEQQGSELLFTWTNYSSMMEAPLVVKFDEDINDESLIMVVGCEASKADDSEIGPIELCLTSSISIGNMMSSTLTQRYEKDGKIYRFRAVECNYPFNEVRLYSDEDSYKIKSVFCFFIDASIGVWGDYNYYTAAIDEALNASNEDIQFNWYDTTDLSMSWNKISENKKMYLSTTSDSKVYLKVIDEFRNESQPFALQLRQDILNPTNVDCVIDHTMTLINVEAKGADTICGVRGYDCTIDGGTTFTKVQPGRFFRFKGLTPNTTYQVFVRAHDKAGNITASTAQNITLS